MSGEGQVGKEGVCGKRRGRIQGHVGIQRTGGNRGNKVKGRCGEGEWQACKAVNYKVCGRGRMCGV